LDVAEGVLANLAEDFPVLCREGVLARDSPIRFLYDHAIELYLKAHLSACGVHPYDMRIKSSHDAGKLSKRSASKSTPMHIVICASAYAVRRRCRQCAHANFARSLLNDNFDIEARPICNAHGCQRCLLDPLSQNIGCFVGQLERLQMNVSLR
jgi:hypothetical protein